MEGENCSFAVATGMVEHECIVYTRLKQERDALRAALEELVYLDSWGEYHCKYTEDADLTPIVGAVLGGSH